MVFTTTSSARHRFAAGATRGRKFGGRENGGGKAWEGKGGDMESILFTSISQHSHTAAQIKGSPSRGAKMVVP